MMQFVAARRRAVRRGGFTLVEMLVAAAILIALASITLVIVPDVMSQDRTVDGAATVRQWLAIAKARAARDQLPRGLRLITGPDPTKPKKVNPLWATEAQYLESPAILVPNPIPNGSPAGFTAPAPSQAYVRIVYTTNAAGAIIGRQVQITNLTPGQAAQVGPGSVLMLPAWDMALKVDSTAFTPTDPATITQLDGWMGAETQYVTYLFGLYSPPRPLLGEANLLMPDKVCVDLTASSPAGTLLPVLQDYDIVFAPNGSVILGPAAGSGHALLWVRDYEKLDPGVYPSPIMLLSPGPPAVYDENTFRKGGEQQIVALKTKSGALGVFPVTWPSPGGTYPPGQSPYYFARIGANGP